jgi:hypothetical protein
MEPKISIELPLAAWNIIFNALGQRPYVEVAELVAAVKAQADAQLTPPTDAPSAL